GFTRGDRAGRGTRRFRPGPRRHRTEPVIQRLIAASTAGLLLAPTAPAPAIADPVRDAQWHLEFLDVAGAHDITRGEGVVVAVIDSGVDAGNPDLTGKVLDGVTLLANDGDAYGHTDLDGHGTRT